jgi:outer membrane biosynthesis protein TonB
VPGVWANPNPNPSPSPNPDPNPNPNPSPIPSPSLSPNPSRNPSPNPSPNPSQACGHKVPDETSPGTTDAEVCLTEATPTATEAPLVRGGWYRGPRGPVVFVLACPACGERSLTLP